MNYLRKTICLMLVLSMMFGLFTLNASAADTESSKPDASQEDPEKADASQSKSMGFLTSGYVESARTMPLYDQTEYTTSFGRGTVSTSGCTMTALAMVASYFRGEEILPDNLAKRFNRYEASNLQRMEAASIVLDLTFEKVQYWEDVDKALDEGKVVIALMGRASLFTNSQHTIVLTGKTLDGKILVNDPYGPNYKKAELKKGFEEGFDPSVFSRGFGGAWVYDGYAPSRPGMSRYPEIKLTPDEKKMIASIIWLESRGEPFEGQQAVAEVIFNRLFSDGFADNVSGVILVDGMFRTAKFLDEAEPGELQYKAIEKALAGPNVLPEEIYYFARTATNDHVWGRIGRHVFCYA